MLLSFSLLRRSLLLAAFGLLVSSVVQANGPVRVGSKIDTEGKLLGNIMVLALEANGIKTENKVSLGNTKIVRTALVAGEIDIYPEYTGNGAFMLGAEKSPAWKDLRAGYELAKKMDFEKNKIVWLEPANANNTWAIAVRKDLATANQLRSMEDVVATSPRAAPLSWPHRPSSWSEPTPCLHFRRLTDSNCALTKPLFWRGVIQPPPSRLLQKKHRA
jgi:osmoprotectant transport system substrate-binding protein